MLLPYYHNIHEAGTDEAGRGCLAGPVTAASVVMYGLQADNCAQWTPLVNDSKKLSEKQRMFLRPIIEESVSDFTVTHIQPDCIDEINILNASLLAMQKCILKLSSKPIHIIVDGNRDLIAPTGLKQLFHKFHAVHEIKILNNIAHTAIIKGDEKYLSIAAASVLAKTYRDEYMNQIHEEYPMYNWAKNKGYPTKEHRAAIKKYGITKYHRKSFRLLPEIDLFDIKS